MGVKKCLGENGEIAWWSDAQPKMGNEVWGSSLAAFIGL
jgi:hypothetical protein